MCEQSVHVIYHRISCVNRVFFIPLAEIDLSYMFC